MSAVKPLQIEAWTPMLNRPSDAQVDAALGDSTAHVLHRTTKRAANVC